MGDALRRAAFFGLAATLALTGASCARRDTAPPLGPPPAGAAAAEPPAASGAASAYRYAAALRTNVLAATRARAVAPDHYSVELRNLVVGPGKTSEPIQFRGATVVLVDAGNGTALIGERRSELRGGASFVIPRGARFSFDNPGSGAILLRAVTFAEER